MQVPMSLILFQAMLLTFTSDLLATTALKTKDLISNQLETATILSVLTTNEAITTLYYISGITNDNITININSIRNNNASSTERSSQAKCSTGFNQVGISAQSLNINYTSITNAAKNSLFIFISIEASIKDNGNNDNYEASSINSNPVGSDAFIFNTGSSNIFNSTTNNWKFESLRNYASTKNCGFDFKSTVNSNNPLSFN